MNESRLRHLLPRFAGEFLTIVLGVLVALGVDEWRGSQAEVRQEAEYFASLIEDLDRDTAEYRMAQDFIEVSIGAGEQVVAAIEGSAAGEAAFSTLTEAVQYASWVNYPAWSSGTLDEMVSSGSIRLIRDPEIKRAILAYYDEVEEWKPRLRGPEFQSFIGYRRVTLAWLPKGPESWVRDQRAAPAPASYAAQDPTLQRRLLANDEVLGLTRAMLWEWHGLSSFMQSFHDQAVELRDRLADQVDGAG